MSRIEQYGRVGYASAFGNLRRAGGVSPTVTRVLSIAAVALLAVACRGTGEPGQSSGPRLVRSGAVRAVSLDLSTHCGIDEARLGATYYEADHPLNDGSGNPPPGWPNPTDSGTATTSANGTLVFRDSLGHTVAFHPRPGARAWKRLCS